MWILLSVIPRGLLISLGACCFRLICCRIRLYWLIESLNTVWVFLQFCSRWSSAICLVMKFIKRRQPSRKSFESLVLACLMIYDVFKLVVHPSRARATNPDQYSSPFRIVVLLLTSYDQNRRSNYEKTVCVRLTEICLMFSTNCSCFLLWSCSTSPESVNILLPTMILAISTNCAKTKTNGL